MSNVEDMLNLSSGGSVIQGVISPQMQNLMT